MTTLSPEQLDRLAIDTIRTLAIDGVQQASSGHPGAPMGMAPMAYTLWTRFLRHAPTHPDWPNRDRFVLSAGHASMLVYSLLHLTGYDLSLDELKRFRQWGSRRAEQQAGERLERAGALESDLAKRESALITLQKEVAGKHEAAAQERSKLDVVQRELATQAEQIKRERAALAAQQQETAGLEQQIQQIRTELAQQQQQLAAQRKAIDTERDTVQARAVELEQLSLHLNDRKKELEAQSKQVAALQLEWQTKLHELNAASAGLAALQKQLDGELTSLTEQTDALLPQYGVTRDQPAGTPAAGIPAATEQKANASVERFQKLCRDAKRRVVGS